jgi:hypothetical protein
MLSLTWDNHGGYLAAASLLQDSASREGSTVLTAESGFIVTATVISIVLLCKNTEAFDCANPYPDKNKSSSQMSAEIAGRLK